MSPKKQYTIKTAMHITNERFPIFHVRYFFFKDTKIREAKKQMDARTEELGEKHMEKLENGLKNRQEQLTQLIDRLKEHVCIPQSHKRLISWYSLKSIF